MSHLSSRDSRKSSDQIRVVLQISITYAFTARGCTQDCLLQLDYSDCGYLYRNLSDIQKPDGYVSSLVQFGKVSEKKQCLADIQKPSNQKAPEGVAQCFEMQLTTID